MACALVGVLAVAGATLASPAVGAPPADGPSTPASTPPSSGTTPDGTTPETGTPRPDVPGVDDPLGPHTPPAPAVPGAPAGTGTAPGAGPAPPGTPAPSGTPASPVATVDLAAVRDLDAALDLAAAERRLATADAVLSVVTRRRDLTARVHRAAAREVEHRRTRLRHFAVRLYKGGDRLGDLAVVADAEDLTDLARRQTLLVAADESEVRRLRSARDAERRVAAALDSAEADRARVSVLRRTRARERDEARRSGRGGTPLDGWRPGADGPLVQGRSRLTAAEMAAWFRSTGRRENTTVPIDELARLYVQEGRAEGVRGDIAFAQSILETGSFHFAPGGTVLTVSDNNFAGIGACDSCERGWSFPSARLGVRQQVQLLRAYADPRLVGGDLAHPPVRSRPERLGVRGCCEAWLGLNGVWATGAGYGERILEIWSGMARFALARR